jgi:hypothetical protein
LVRKRLRKRRELGKEKVEKIEKNLVRRKLRKRR